MIDWGITKEVDTSEAVRWVILIIICVFDPLAVLLLVAANQSLIRKFPVEPIKPQEIVDLEKPDDEGVDLKWNAMMDKSDAAARMEAATEQLREWKQKLEEFNAKVPQPKYQPVEIIQEDKDTVPHIDLKGKKKTEDKEIVADNMTDGFDPAEVEGYEEFNSKYGQDKKLKEEQLERFKQREKEEQKAREEVARKAKEEEMTATVEEALKMNESESVMTPIEEPTISEQIEEAMEPERTRPDFTEVIEPEAQIEKPKDIVKNSKPRVMRTLRRTEGEPPKPVLSNWQRAELLNNFHKEHGNFEDVKEYVQNEEQNENTLWQQANKSRKRLTSEEDYHQRMEQRIEDLMAKIDAGEITLEDLTPEDRQVIIEINKQHEI